MNYLINIEQCCNNYGLGRNLFSPNDFNDKRAAAKNLLKIYSNSESFKDLLDVTLN